MAAFVDHSSTPTHSSPVKSRLYVIKRDGRQEPVSFDKITTRLINLCDNLEPRLPAEVDPAAVAQKVIQGVFAGVKTTELDNLAAETAAYMSTQHPGYGDMAARIAVSNLHKQTEPSFSKVMKAEYEYINPKNNVHSPLIAEDVYNIVMKHSEKLDSAIVHERDYLFDYFGFKTLERSYLVRLSGVIVERPQHMFLRVAVGIHKEDVDAAIDTYNLMSQKFFTHATPTLFNAGTPTPQMSSCFVEGTKICTVNRGVVNIEDAKIGDLVVTHLGNVKPVVQLHKNPLGNRLLYTVNTAKSRPVTVTENHRFWSIRSRGKRSQPGWNSIGDLQVGDYIAIPKWDGNIRTEIFDLATIIDCLPKKSGELEYSYQVTDHHVIATSSYTVKNHRNGFPVDFEHESQPVKRFWTIDQDFAQFLGIWYGDGSVTTAVRNGRSALKNISIAAHPENHKLIEFCRRVMKDKFGVHVSELKAKDQNLYSLVANSTTLAAIFSTLFGKGYGGKRLWNRCFEWHKSLVAALIDGLVCSDGWVTKDLQVGIAMSNSEFMTSLYHLLRQRGIAASYVQKKRNLEDKNFTCQMLLPLEDGFFQNVWKTYEDDRLLRLCKPQGNREIKIDGMTFLRISSKIEKSISPEYVYTLGIEDDHSYNVEGLVAENCFLLSMKEDSIEGIYDTLKRCALISKSAGGIGLSVHCIRGANSWIKGTNGTSNGLVPMLKVFNDTARYVDQCFPGETLICTSEGSRPIGSLREGDRVLTHAGTMQPVNKVMKYIKKEKLLNVGVKHSIEPVHVTEQHPFLVLKNQEKGLNFSIIRNRLKKGLAKLEWVDAKDLAIGDFVAFPVSNGDDRDNNWSEDDCRFYGILCGNGWVSKKEDQCRVNLNTPVDGPILRFLKSYLESKGIKWNLSEKEPGSKCQIVYFNPSSLRHFITREFLYDSNDEKIIHPSLLFLPKDKVLALLRGLVESDGHMEKKEVLLEMTSRCVIENIRFMLMRHGVLTSGNIRDCSQVQNDSGFAHKKISYTIRIPRTPSIAKVLGVKPSQSVSFLSYENYMLSRIDSLKEGEESEHELFDLEVEGEHSYVTPSGSVHNGGGKRKGAFAVYLEPWHSDIFEFLELRKNTGKEEQRARDLFYALWIPDLFMKRVEEDGDWALFCPNEAKNLHETWGEEFEKLYTEYEKVPGLARKVVKAQDLWFAILESQIETGTPYMLYKDACNRKSNHQHLGCIKSSNLCTEVVEYTSSDEVAVCMTGETPILTSNGYKRLDECDGEKVLVPFRSDVTFVAQTEYVSAKLVENGVRQTFEITLSGSSSIKATDNHKFLTISSKNGNKKQTHYEWKTVKELIPGDRIFSPIHDTLPEFAKVSARDHSNEWMTIGCCIGDGWQHPNTPQQQAAFLSGYFSANGCLTHDKKSKIIALSSANESMLYQVQNCLRNFGIHSEVRFGEFKTRPGKYQGTLTISGIANLRKFRDYIGFVLSPIKQEKLVEHINQYQPKITTTTTSRDYLEVVSIEKKKFEKVYDLCLPFGHNFVANGVVTHNCNLASIALPKFVIDGKFDHHKLYEITKVVTRNLNKIIDGNHYPIQEARNSNMRHRPIGIGVQGLADVFIKLRLPFDSEGAAQLNKEIFETIYFAALSASKDIAKMEGTYPSFPGSPVSRGILQPDMWGVTPTERWDWSALRTEIREFGVRNSLLVAPMPTASTSQILGNNECFVGETPITLTSGIAKRIDSMNGNANVYGWNGKDLQSSKQTRLIPQGEKETVKLTFEDGRTITCTKDHRFLLVSGEWKQAKDLELGHDRIFCGLEGVLDVPSSDEERYRLKTEEYEFSFRNQEEREKTLALARILGYMLSDGTVGTNDRNGFLVEATLGSKIDAENFAKDVGLIEGCQPQIYDSGITFKVRLHPKLSRSIATLEGVTIGKRIDQEYQIPSFLKDPECPKSMIREFLAGHFGGDGQAPFLTFPSSGSSTLRGIQLSHHVAQNHQGSLQIFMTELCALLERAGILGASISTEKKAREDTIEYRVFVPATTAFGENIGFRYAIQKMLRLSAAHSYWRNNGRQEKSPEEYFRNIGVLEWFSHQDCIIKRDATNLPTMHLAIVDRREAGRNMVWDISVSETHSFLASGVVAHNCFEPYTSNIYTRRVLAGEFTIVNKQLIHDLMARGLWTSEIRNKIIAHNGSIQRIEEIPSDLKSLYKTVWEISQRTILNMAADRGAFIDQSQSLNIFIAEPDFAKLTSMHFYAWKKGLKTGMYYLRTRPAADAIKFTVDAQALNKPSQAVATETATPVVPTSPAPQQQPEKEEAFVCKKEADCWVCSS